MACGSASSAAAQLRADAHAPIAESAALALSCIAKLLKYHIIRCNSGVEQYDQTDDIIGWCKENGIGIEGEHSSGATHSWMQGQPVLQGFVGPLGSSKDPEYIRYEDTNANDFYSR
jgi:hypothetical protein